MNQAPVTFQPAGIPSAEDMTLFNAGITWNVLAGFPAVPSPDTLPSSPQPSDEPKKP